MRRPTIVRISPMAHFMSGFLALGILAFVLYLPILAPLLAVPVVISYAIYRYQTAVDTESVQVRTLTTVRTLPWTEVKGLGFDKHAWAHAQLVDGTSLRLPAVTFSTLPILSAASNGRVPNPYEGVTRD
ncbi:PH domain-containing protein [Mycobacteroides saopaulense]|uniref:PH domain-containing protein n=1 Tax=Mycobacteroides saopaulense TaxID=1578165 RepID=UPI001F47B885|nr:PH domain-containing protein [Mycobacteroides saopaulense]